MLPWPAPASEVDKAAAMIRSAARPVLMIGVRGADVEACEAVRALLARTALPVVETFQGAGVVSRALESCYVGRVGLFKNQPGDVIVAHADVLVTIGYDPVEYDPRLWNADPGRAVIHVTTCTASELHLSLPRTAPFLSADLSPADTNAQIKQTEGD